MKNIVFLLLLFSFQKTFGQNPLDSATKSKIDSISKHASLVKKHPAGLAALYSAVLPGLGQAYNKKYWKIPIVLGGLGGLGYGWFSNANNYSTAKTSYATYYDDDTLNSTPFVKAGKIYTDRAQIKQLRDGFKRDMDMFIILSVLWYTLNIIDATVDAHLFRFDVSDNMSMEIKPAFQYSNNQAFAGINLKLELCASKKKLYHFNQLNL